MRARVHHVVCDFEGSCPNVTPGARHARWAIADAARAGWTRVREYDDGRWYVRDYCPTHSPKEPTS
jgi:hypothetical protein